MIEARGLGRLRRCWLFTAEVLARLVATLDGDELRGLRDALIELLDTSRAALGEHAQIATLTIPISIGGHGVQPRAR